jgi:hypothetical protein
MKLLLQRRFSEQDWMSGSLSVGGVYFCKTMEDELRAVKVMSESAIPAGTYRVTLEVSPKYGPDTLTINDVPGFTAIRIHSGRNDDDTSGCILVGDQVNEALGTISGGLAKGIKAKLIQMVKDAIALGEEVTLEIRNARGARFVDNGELVAVA